MQMTFADIPQTHSHDPQSSYGAETRHRENGRMATHADYVLDLVRRWPNFTSRELSETDGCRLDLVEVRRRLTTLLNQGLVEQVGERKCTVARTKAVVWREAK